MGKRTNKILIIIIIILILLLILSISISIIQSNKKIVEPEPKTLSYNSSVVEIEHIQEKNEVLVAILDKNEGNKDDSTIVIGAEGENISEINNTVENNTSPYYIKINVQANVITIYKKDGNGNYNIPLKTMVCSCGTTTQTEGTYSLRKYNNWQWKTVDNKLYAQYATQISGDILFHSMPYAVKGDKSTLQYEEYDKLGTYTTSQSILLTVADAKWIYENCPPETQVTFYISDTASPLNVTKSQLITEDVEVRGWDPTDPDENNPWKTYVRPERPPETSNQENDNDNENQNTNTLENDMQNNTSNNNVEQNDNEQENNNTLENNEITNSTDTNNTIENENDNNTIDSNIIDNNIQNNQTKVPENKILEENEDVTIKSEVIDTNNINNN